MMTTFSHFFSRMYAVAPGFHSGRGEHIHSSAWQPPIDIYERPEALVVVVELPGVDKNQVNVRVADGVLQINGFRPKQLPDATQHVHQMEIPYGAFERRLHLPQCADIEHIEASYQDGYLTVEIPRTGAQGKGS